MNKKFNNRRAFLKQGALLGGGSGFVEVQKA